MKCRIVLFFILFFPFLSFSYAVDPMVCQMAMIAGMTGQMHGGSQDESIEGLEQAIQKADAGIEELEESLEEVREEGLADDILKDFQCTPCSESISGSEVSEDIKSHILKSKASVKNCSPEVQDLPGIAVATTSFFWQRNPLLISALINKAYADEEVVVRESLDEETKNAVGQAVAEIAGAADAVKKVAKIIKDNNIGISEEDQIKLENAVEFVNTGQGNANDYSEKVLKAENPRQVRAGIERLRETAEISSSALQVVDDIYLSIPMSAENEVLIPARAELREQLGRTRTTAQALTQAGRALQAAEQTRREGAAPSTADRPIRPRQVEAPTPVEPSGEVEDVNLCGGACPEGQECKTCSGQTPSSSCVSKPPPVACYGGGEVKVYTWDSNNCQYKLNNKCSKRCEACPCHYKQYFKNNGQIDEDKLCANSSLIEEGRSSRECKKTIKEMEEIAGDIQELEEELDELEGKLREKKRECRRASRRGENTAGCGGAGGTEAGTFCIECFNSVIEANRPKRNMWEKLGSALVPLAGASLGYLGIRETNKMRARQGYPVDNSAAYGLAYPFVMRALYGGGLNGRGSNALSCSSTAGMGGGFGLNMWSQLGAGLTGMGMMPGLGLGGMPNFGGLGGMPGVGGLGGVPGVGGFQLGGSLMPGFGGLGGMPGLGGFQLGGGLMPGFGGMPAGLGSSFIPGLAMPGLSGLGGMPGVGGFQLGGGFGGMSGLGGGFQQGGGLDLAGYYEMRSRMASIYFEQQQMQQERNMMKMNASMRIQQEIQKLVTQLHSINSGFLDGIGGGGGSSFLPSTSPGGGQR